MPELPDLIKTNRQTPRNSSQRLAFRKRNSVKPNTSVTADGLEELANTEIGDASLKAIGTKEYRMVKTVLFWAWFVFPALAYGANLLSPRRLSMVGMWILTCAIACVLLLTVVWATDVQLKAKLDRYDLDGNGFFTPDELTPAAEQAFQEYTNDTGRSFAVCSGIPISITWVTICFSALCLFEWTVSQIVKQIRPPSNDPVQSKQRPFFD